METSASPAAIAADQQTASGADDFKTIADDRLEGAEAIGLFIGNLTPREARRLLEEGHYPHWREGRVYVASKAALLTRLSLFAGCEGVK